MSHTYESYSISVLSKFCSRSTICFSVACQSVFFKSPLYFFIVNLRTANLKGLKVDWQGFSLEKIFETKFLIAPFRIDTPAIPVYVQNLSRCCPSSPYYNCSSYSQSSQNSPGWDFARSKCPTLG